MACKPGLFCYNDNSSIFQLPEGYCERFNFYTTSGPFHAQFGLSQMIVGDPMRSKAKARNLNSLRIPAETPPRHRFIDKQGMKGAVYFIDPTVNRYHQSFKRKW